MEKYFLVSDDYGSETVKATSPRQACIQHIRNVTSAEKPRLTKIYVDGKDGSTYHVGYGYSHFWMRVAELVPMRVRQEF